MKAFNNFIYRADVQLVLYVLTSFSLLFWFFLHYSQLIHNVESAKGGDFNKVYQLFSLFISLILSGIFIYLGKSKGENRVDTGYSWLAIAMLVWQVSASIMLIHQGDQEDVSEIRFLLNMSNSFSLLLAIPHFNFLEEHNSIVFQYVQKIRAFLNRQDLSFAFKVFVFIPLAASVFKLANGDIVDTGSQFMQILKMIQPFVNLGVVIIIPATLWFIFREREIGALNLLSVLSFIIVVIYELLERLDYAPSFPVDSASLMFAYKIFLFIIFFSLSASYRVYENKKQVIILEGSIKEQKKQLSDSEQREKESKQQLQIQKVKSPIERFLYSFLVIIKSHHGAEGTDEDILAKGNFAPVHHTFHGSGWKSWQQQSFYPSLQDLMQERALETNTKGFDDAMNSVFKSICYRSLNMDIIIYLMWVCLRRRGNINDSESAITQSEYCLEHLIKLESNYNILDTYFWKDYQQVLQSMYAFFYAILFKQKTNDCILEAIEIEERKFLFSVSIGEKNIENLLAKIDSKSKPRTGDTAIHLFDLNASLKDKATVHLSVSHSNKKILNVNIIKNGN